MGTGAQPQEDKGKPPAESQVDREQERPRSVVEVDSVPYNAEVHTRLPRASHYASEPAVNAYLVGQIGDPDKTGSAAKGIKVAEDTIRGYEQEAQKNRQAVAELARHLANGGYAYVEQVVSSKEVKARFDAQAQNNPNLIRDSDHFDAMFAQAQTHIAGNPEPLLEACYERLRDYRREVTRLPEEEIELLRDRIKDLQRAITLDPDVSYNNASVRVVSGFSIRLECPIIIPKQSEMTLDQAVEYVTNATSYSLASQQLVQMGIVPIRSKVLTIPTFTTY